MSGALARPSAEGANLLLRIQRRRTRGWRMPPNTISVCRPGRWGNPYRPSAAIKGDYCSIPEITPATAVSLYRQHINGVLDGAFGLTLWDEMNAQIRGRNLACWCHLCPAHAEGKPLGQPCPDCAPCHTDVLGQLANPGLRCELVPEAADG